MPLRPKSTKDKVSGEDVHGSGAPGARTSKPRLSNGSAVPITPSHHAEDRPTATPTSTDRPHLDISSGSRLSSGGGKRSTIDTVSTTPSHSNNGNTLHTPSSQGTSHTVPSSSGTASTGSTGADLIKVCVRIRPMSREERESGDTIVWKWDGNTIAPINIAPIKKGATNSFSTIQAEYFLAQNSQYSFDHIFDPDVTTPHIFDTAVQDIVSSTMNGFHGSVFSYGQTASGKTFTMNGVASQLGIIPQAVCYCFNSIESYPDREFLIRVSYLEVYNEQIKDLLSTEPVTIKIQHDPKQGTVLSGVKEHVVLNYQQVLALIRAGEAQRHVGVTDMNEKSSRAHTLFKIIVESKERSSKNTPVRMATLNLVDLAGSESAKMTNTSGERLKEARHINQSLLALSTIIQRLSEDHAQHNGRRSQHLPFRDSKLTRLLESALDGNGKIAIICTISPTLKCVEETGNTLKFGTRAKMIQMHAKLNETVDDKTLLRAYREEIEQLKQRLREFEERQGLLRSQPIPSDVPSNYTNSSNPSGANSYATTDPNGHRHHSNAETGDGISANQHGDSAAGYSLDDAASATSATSATSMDVGLIRVRSDEDGDGGAILEDDEEDDPSVIEEQNAMLQMILEMERLILKADMTKGQQQQLAQTTKNFMSSMHNHNQSSSSHTAALDKEAIAIRGKNGEKRLSLAKLSSLRNVKAATSSTSSSAVAPLSTRNSALASSTNGGVAMRTPSHRNATSNAPSSSTPASKSKRPPTATASKTSSPSKEGRDMVKSVAKDNSDTGSVASKGSSSNGSTAFPFPDLVEEEKLELEVDSDSLHVVNDVTEGVDATLEDDVGATAADTRVSGSASTATEGDSGLRLQLEDVATVNNGNTELSIKLSTSVGYEVDPLIASSSTLISETGEGSDISGSNHIVSSISPNSTSIGSQQTQTALKVSPRTPRNSAAHTRPSSGTFSGASSPVVGNHHHNSNSAVTQGNNTSAPNSPTKSKGNGVDLGNRRLPPQPLQTTASFYGLNGAIAASTPKLSSVYSQMESTASRLGVTPRQPLGSTRGGGASSVSSNGSVGSNNGSAASSSSSSMTTDMLLLSPSRYRLQQHLQETAGSHASAVDMPGTGEGGSEATLSPRLVNGTAEGIASMNGADVVAEEDSVLINVSKMLLLLKDYIAKPKSTRMHRKSSGGRLSEGGSSAAPERIRKSPSELSLQRLSIGSSSSNKDGRDSSGGNSMQSLQNTQQLGNSRSHTPSDMNSPAVSSHDNLNHNQPLLQPTQSTTSHQQQQQLAIESPTKQSSSAISPTAPSQHLVTLPASSSTISSSSTAQHTHVRGHSFSGYTYPSQQQQQPHSAAGLSTHHTTAHVVTTGGTLATEDNLRLDLRLKEADNLFLQEELENKDKMLSLLTEGLKEVEESQRQWLTANQDLSKELGRERQVNARLWTEIDRLQALLAQHGVVDEEAERFDSVAVVAAGVAHAGATTAVETAPGTMVNGTVEPAELTDAASATLDVPTAVSNPTLEVNGVHDSVAKGSEAVSAPSVVAVDVTTTLKASQDNVPGTTASLSTERKAMTKKLSYDQFESY